MMTVPKSMNVTKNIEDYTPNPYSQSQTLRRFILSRAKGRILKFARLHRAKVARTENKRGHRPSVQIVRRLVRSAAATFEMRSNLFENVHYFLAVFYTVRSS